MGSHSHPGGVPPKGKEKKRLKKGLAPHRKKKNDPIHRKKGSKVKEKREKVLRLKKGNFLTLGRVPILKGGTAPKGR